MKSQNQGLCPNCGRKLTENELYCNFCELNLEKYEKEDLEIKNSKKKNDDGTFFEKIKSKFNMKRK